MQRVIGHLRRVIGHLQRDVAGGVENSRTVTVSLEVGNATVASRLSLTPGYFSRALNELESAGRLRLDPRDVHVLDLDLDLDRLAANSG